MARPLGLVFFNAFLVYFEKNWLQNCPTDSQTHYCWWYVDAIFALFTYLEHLPKFSKWLA